MFLRKISGFSGSSGISEKNGKAENRKHCCTLLSAACWVVVVVVVVVVDGGGVWISALESE